MGKGRDKNLIDLRNYKLCHRYYYWTEVVRLRFDDVLKVLSEKEFFISEERIMAIIRDCYNNSNYISDKPINKPIAPDKYALFPNNKPLKKVKSKRE